MLDEDARDSDAAMSPIPIPPPEVARVYELWGREPGMRGYFLKRRWYVDAEGREIDLPIVPGGIAASIERAFPG